jgi:hypothetical protein
MVFLIGAPRHDDPTGADIKAQRLVVFLVCLTHGWSSFNGLAGRGSGRIAAISFSLACFGLACIGGSGSNYSQEFS